MSLSLVILLVVFLGIALRQVCRIPLKIWQIMGIGALAVIFTGRISLIAAFQAIDWSIIAFLWGMFYVGQALEESGMIGEFAARHFHRGCSTRKILLWIVFGMGLCSGVLMNDTLAIVGTPLLLRVAHQRKIHSHALLLVLAFSITIGSVMSPIGNPQNLLIALGAPIASPFLTFLKVLAVPTLINLVLLFFLAQIFLKKEENPAQEVELSHPYNKGLMVLCRIAMGVILTLIGYNIIASFFPFPLIPLPWIALIPAFFLLIFGPRKKEVLKALDWQTLIFFIGMFILMRSVWETLSVKEIPLVHSSGGIMAFSALLSQLISNVPLVALYLPILQEAAPTTTSYMALAAGSTIAGNFLIFGAASNLIIIQNAEKRGEKGISFFEFAKFGIPLTIFNLLIYFVFV